MATQKKVSETTDVPEVPPSPEVVVEAPKPKTKTPKEYIYRIAYLTPSGGVKGSIPASIMMEGRRTWGWVLEALRNDPGTITDHYMAYVRYAQKSHADSVRSQAEFGQALDKLTEMGLIEKTAK